RASSMPAAMTGRTLPRNLIAVGGVELRWRRCRRGSGEGRRCSPCSRSRSRARRAPRRRRRRPPRHPAARPAILHPPPRTPPPRGSVLTRPAAGSGGLLRTRIARLREGVRQELGISGEPVILARLGIDPARPVIVSWGIVDPDGLRALLASPRAPAKGTPFV